MSEHSAEKDAPECHPNAWVPAGSLRAYDLGKWIMSKGLDRPKQIIRVIHNESSTAVHWYRDPEKRDGTSGMVASHDHMVMLYHERPTRVTPPGGGR